MINNVIKEVGFSNQAGPHTMFRLLSRNVTLLSFDFCRFHKPSLNNEGKLSSDLTRWPICTYLVVKISIFVHDGVQVV